MYKSILFSFKIDSIEFQSTNSELIMSTPFIKDEIILKCQERLNDKGYSVSGYENFNFVKKDDNMYVEGMAHEIQEMPFIDVSFL